MCCVSGKPCCAASRARSSASLALADRSVKTNTDMTVARWQQMPAWVYYNSLWSTSMPLQTLVQAMYRQAWLYCPMVWVQQMQVKSFWYEQGPVSKRFFGNVGGWVQDFLYVRWARDWTWDLAHGRQSRYHCTMSPQAFVGLGSCGQSVGNTQPWTPPLLIAMVGAISIITDGTVYYSYHGSHKQTKLATMLSWHQLFFHTSRL